MVYLTSVATTHIVQIKDLQLIYLVPGTCVAVMNTNTQPFGLLHVVVDIFENGHDKTNPFVAGPVGKVFSKNLDVFLC